ncbi:hypothetical protein [Mangrovibacillus cuniculi]|uniref:Uncharacterized protein n=1 Tax=Mangrovibacillus cuniculi TaxID=2593652 RepID=A0A7S8HFF2_9BACI|nr:hypothetical protein [Mangrovibacillus cuniculi]QPC46370.1 hypothetical protein G8O30_05015 [Mangrovibacillus cuniculi]
MMTLKAIEMQVALPRTIDAGKLSEQMQQRGQIAQSVIADEAIKKQERERKVVSQKEQVYKSKNSLENNTPQTSNNNGEPKVSEQRRKNSLGEHPYKGKSVDYSG